MTINKFEVVIIGGGPSGSIAGNILTKNGISCCIIDKAKFPRDKLCGGGLTQKSIDLLKEIGLSLDVSELYNNSSNKIKMYHKDKLFFDINIDTPYYFTNRFEFDNMLLESFKSNGGVLYDGYKVKEINLEKNVVKISDIGEISFKFIIGADGANSVVRKLIDKKYKPNGFCVEVELPKAITKGQFEATEIHFGDFKNGYLWTFPKRNSITVGLGGDYYENIDYPKLLIDFLKSKEIPTDNLKIKGHYIPFGEYIQTPEKDEKLLLVGDAAGLVDPINGEGIYFSIFSGKLAAEFILDKLKTNSSLSSYTNKLKPIHRTINDGNLLKKLFYNSHIQSIIFNIFKNKGSAVSYCFDNLISTGKYEYRNILKLMHDYKKQK